MKCPYCAEQVKDEAIVCRYCQRDLTSVRLNSLEQSVKEHLQTVEETLSAFDRRLEQIESRLDLGPQPRREPWRVYVLALLVGGTAPTLCVNAFYAFHAGILLLVPFLVLIGVGAGVSFAVKRRAVGHYFVLGTAMGIMSFVGVTLTIQRIVYGWTLAQGFLLMFYLSTYKSWTPLLLFIAPIFLVALGGFIGEWLESMRPAGRQMDYPRELAERLVRLRSRTADRPSLDVEKLSALIAAIAPIVAAIGGIVAPVITLVLETR